jgi:curved DNA-binding protein CbpA
MVSSVRSRPNHYEVLGLSPAASQDEIAGAFAKAMGMFGTRPVALAAQLSAAFETLRNPAKRRAYDSALGLRPEPQLRPWGIAATQRGGARFADSAWGRSSDQPGPELRSAAPEVPAQPTRPAPLAEPRLPEFIAAALRDAPNSDPRTTTSDVRPQLPPELRVETQPKAFEPLVPPRRAEADSSRDEAIDWRRPALAIGALFLVAGGVGVTAGLSAGGEAQEAQAANDVTVPLPTAKSQSRVAAPASAGPAVVADVQPARSPRLQRVAAERTAAPEQPVRLTEEQLGLSSPMENGSSVSAFVESATDQAAAEVPASEPVAAAMPLPKRVVARTIERIGYSCGEVSSITSVERGVFKVTCTSGQSYRAAPVDGRYRFRRWSGR